MSIEEQTYNLLNKTLEVVQALPEATKWISLITDLKSQVDKPCTLAIAGAQNAGKSSFLNAFLGKKLAKVGDAATTATINKFRYGTPKNPNRPVLVHWSDGRVTEEALSFMDSLQGKDEETLSKAENIDFLEYILNDPALEDLILVDTPGTLAVTEGDGEGHQKRIDRYYKLNQKHHEESQRQTRDADAVIYVVRGVAGKTDKDFLDAFRETTLGGSSLDALGVMTKMDVEEAIWNRRKEQAAYVARSLKDQLFDVVPVSVMIWECTMRHANSFARWQKAIKSVPSKEELDMILTDKDIFLMEDINTYMPHDLCVEIHDTLMQDGAYWSLPRTILHALYEAPTPEDAIAELKDGANMENLRKIIQEHFFERKKSIHCTKILHELKRVIDDLYRNALHNAERASRKSDAWIKEVQNSIGAKNPIVAEELLDFLSKNIRTSAEIERLIKDLTDNVKHPLEQMLLTHEAPNEDYAMRKELEKNRELWEEDEFEELWELFGPKSAEYVASVNRSERQAYWQQLAMMAFDTKIRQTAEHAVELYGRRK